MIKNENKIYDEFLTIEPLDIIRIDKFYLNNLQYFENIPEKKNLEKYLIMLCEIGNTYSFSNKHFEALKILYKVEKIFEKQKENKKYKKQNNSILYWLGYSNFHLNNFYKALKYFKHYVPEENEKDELSKLIEICRVKNKNRIYIIIGILGISILAMKYLIKFHFPENYTNLIQYSGFIGGVLLLIYGISKKDKIIK